MLDVHPVHSRIRSWQDFSLHIATIVVGLCIAVGIEQTLEFIQRRHQIAETLAALHFERESNYKALADNTAAWRWGSRENSEQLARLPVSQVAAETELTQAALTQQYLRGILLKNLVESFPDFPASAGEDEIRQIHHEPDRKSIEYPSPARNLTLRRLKQAGYQDSHTNMRPNISGDPGLVYRFDQSSSHALHCARECRQSASR